MVICFKMSKQPVPEKFLARDVSYKVGEECGYWLKFGAYVHQQAIEEGLLDAQGRLTPAGLQATVSEQEDAKKRKELLRSLRPKARILKDIIKVSRLNHGTSSLFRRGRVAFIDEVKTLLAKINGKFVHFAGDREDCLLVVRTPKEKRGTTSSTFTGTMSEVRQKLDDLIDRLSR